MLNNLTIGNSQNNVHVKIKSYSTLVWAKWVHETWCMWSFLGNIRLVVPDLGHGPTSESIHVNQTRCWFWLIHDMYYLNFCSTNNLYTLCISFYLLLCNGISIFFSIISIYNLCWNHWAPLYLFNGLTRTWSWTSPFS